jgi:DNA-binding NarL/FixJ family response regulator
MGPRDIPLKSTDKPDKLRVILADGQEIFRASLRSLLSQRMDWLNVVGEARDGRELVEKVLSLSPHLVIMEINLPGLSGTRVLANLTAAGARMMVLTAEGESTAAMSAVQAGALGFLHKSCSVDELEAGLRSVAAGQSYVSPMFSQAAIQANYAAKSSPKPPVPKLTARQRQILKLVADGETTKELARKLCISARTAETHRMQLMNRLQIHSTAELTKYAIREGLTTL